MIDLKQTGERIALLRKQHEMTQLTLAATLQVTHQAVSKWETGNALPDIDTLLALAKLFGTTVEHLLEGSDPHISTREEPEDDENVSADKRLYSETMAQVIKTKSSLPMLLEAAEQMLPGDITDCIQTLGIREEDALKRLIPFLKSTHLAQLVKTLKSEPLLRLSQGLMHPEDVADCIQTLGITDPALIRSLSADAHA